MTDLVERLRTGDMNQAWSMMLEAADEIERLRAFADWVDSWVSNSVGSYSVSALDGLFAMTRDKLRALEKSAAEMQKEANLADRSVDETLDMVDAALHQSGNIDEQNVAIGRSALEVSSVGVASAAIEQSVPCPEHPTGRVVDASGKRVCSTCGR